MRGVFRTPGLGQTLPEKAPRNFGFLPPFQGKICFCILEANEGFSCRQCNLEEKVNVTFLTNKCDVISKAFLYALLTRRWLTVAFYSLTVY